MGEEDEGDDICAKVWTRPLIKRGVGAAGGAGAGAGRKC